MQIIKITAAAIFYFFVDTKVVGSLVRLVIHSTMDSGIHSTMH
jgi:hypothetical protein